MWRIKLMIISTKLIPWVQTQCLFIFYGLTHIWLNLKATLKTCTCAI